MVFANEYGKVVIHYAEDELALNQGKYKTMTIEYVDTTPSDQIVEVFIEGKSKGFHMLSKDTYRYCDTDSDIGVLYYLEKNESNGSYTVNKHKYIFFKAGSEIEFVFPDGDLATYYYERISVLGLGGLASIKTDNSKTDKDY